MGLVPVSDGSCCLPLLPKHRGVPGSQAAPSPATLEQGRAAEQTGFDQAVGFVHFSHGTSLVLSHDLGACEQ